MIEADRRLVRHDDDLLAVVRLDDGTDDRQRARHDVDAALAAGWRAAERVFLPARVFVLEPRFHFLPRQPFPVAVVDLAQRRPRDRRQAVRIGDDRGGLERPPHRRAVNRVDGVVAEAARQAPRPERRPSSDKRNVGGAGESILGAERGGAVADEEETRSHASAAILSFSPRGLRIRGPNRRDWRRVPVSGVLYSLTNVTARPVKAGEWNTMETTLDGNHCNIVIMRFKEISLKPLS